MRKRRIAAAFLTVLLLALLPEGAGAAGSADCRYFYQLVRETPGEGSSVFSLYVERTEEDGTPLHAGSVALAAAVSGTLEFTPAEGWETMAVPYPPAADGGTERLETGTAAGGRSYVSFFWYWGDGGGVTAPDGGSNRRQLLGTLTVPAAGLDTAEIELLPWPETAAGRAQVEDWQAAADPDAFLEVIANTWRMPSASLPGQGYYQGYCAEPPAVAGEPDTALRAADLRAGWQGFTLGAFAPEKPAVLLFYRRTDDARTLAARAETVFGEGTGHFRARIEFPELAYETPDGKPLEALPDGAYDLVLVKPSHVVCELRGLAFSGQDCPLLLGVHVELPCGDLDLTGEAHDGGIPLGDGRIGQADRLVLLSWLDRGAADAAQAALPDSSPNGAYYADLDGDGRVSAADLDILMSPGNFNRRSITQDFGTE